MHAAYIQTILEAQSKLQSFDTATTANSRSINNDKSSKTSSGEDDRQQDRLCRQENQAKAIRLFSREQTKGDRHKATRMGFQDASDAKAVMGKVWKTTTSTTLASAASQQKQKKHQQSSLPPGIGLVGTMMMDSIQGTIKSIGAK